MMVTNCTLVSKGKFAMCKTMLATWFTSITGWTLMEPSACGTPLVMGNAISVSALPMSICPQTMLYFLPSSDVLLVSPVMACFVAV